MRNLRNIILLLSLALLLTCDFVNSEFADFPTDAEMITFFETNHSEFETLKQMSDEDSSVFRIANDFTWVRDQPRSGRMGVDRPIGFSEARWNEYRKLFYKLGVKKGLIRSESGDVIELIAHVGGISRGGLEKGYRYSTNNDSCEQSKGTNLEDIIGKRFVCIRIDGNWQLYLRR